MHVAIRTIGGNAYGYGGEGQFQNYAFVNPLVDHSVTVAGIAAPASDYKTKDLNVVWSGYNMAELQNYLTSVGGGLGECIHFYFLQHS